MIDINCLLTMDSSPNSNWRPNGQLSFGDRSCHILPTRRLVNAKPRIAVYSSLTVDDVRSRRPSLILQISASKSSILPYNQAHIVIKDTAWEPIVGKSEKHSVFLEYIYYGK